MSPCVARGGWRVAGGEGCIRGVRCLVQYCVLWHQLADARQWGAGGVGEAAPLPLPPSVSPGLLALGVWWTAWADSGYYSWLVWAGPRMTLHARPLLHVHHQLVVVRDEYHGGEGRQP